MKTTLRKIVVNDDVYLWKREHCHLKNCQISQCVEKVTIYLEGFKKSPLYLLFREQDNVNLNSNINSYKWIIGVPDNGIIWLCTDNINNYQNSKTEHTTINLNRPVVIANIITYFINNGWQPKTCNKPLEIINGLEYLEKIFLINN